MTRKEAQKRAEQYAAQGQNERAEIFRAVVRYWDNVEAVLNLKD